jgi:hypothetical protein
MKNHFLLTEEEKKRIRLLHDKNNQIDGTSILREQAWLRKLLIRSVKTVSNLTSKMAKASLKSLDDVVGAIYRPSNMVKGVNKAGQQVDMIKSYNPKTPPIPRETLESIIRLVDEKKITVAELDKLMKTMPGKLADGTPFRETLHKELKGLLVATEKKSSLSAFKAGESIPVKNGTVTIGQTVVYNINPTALSTGLGDKYGTLIKVFGNNPKSLNTYHIKLDNGKIITTQNPKHISPRVYSTKGQPKEKFTPRDPNNPGGSGGSWSGSN